MDWKGKWIWDRGEERPVNYYLYLRKTFELAGKPARAEARVCADSRYKLWVNGRFVCRGPVRSDPRWQYYDVVDLAPYLRPGKNVIAALVHHYGTGTFAYILSRAALLFDAALSYRDAPLVGSGVGLLNPEIEGGVGLRTSGSATASSQHGVRESNSRTNIGGGRGSSRASWSAVSDHRFESAIVDRDDPAKAKASQTSLSQSIVSDETWKVLPAQAWFPDLPRMEVQLEFNEVYDANLAPEGWTEPHFDDSAWAQAKVIGEVGTSPWQNLTPREIPFMFEREVFPKAVLEAGICDPVGIELPRDNKVPVAAIMSREAKDKRDGVISDPQGICRRPSVEDIFEVRPLNPGGKTERSVFHLWQEANVGQGGLTVLPLSEEERYAGKGVYVTLDFGREIAGHPRIRLSTRGKGIVDIGYGELLDGQGKVHPYRAGVNYADRYIIRIPSPPAPLPHGARGDVTTVQEWEAFDKRAFRYMELDFRDVTEPVTVESVSVLFSTYPVEWRGSFECSDERLNEIWRIGAYTVQLNMEDAYTDCPWRERAQWWGDARIEALSNYYAFGDRRLVRQGIRHIGQSQREDGATIPFWPGSYGEVIPAFCLYWIMSIWDYYMFTGDEALVREMEPKVRKLIKWFEGFKDKRGLLTNVPGWMFIEWTAGDLKGTVSALNCLYYRALVDASKIARLAGEDRAGLQYRRRAEQVKAAINSHLYDPKRRAYPEYWSDGAFAPKVSQMVNGLVSAYGIAPVGRRKAVLEYALDPKNDVVPTGSFFAYYLLLGLFENGMVQEALDYIRTNWGKMLDWGATTFWEHWHPENSLCHGWASAPTIHLPAYVLGVRPTEPGFRRFVVAPNPTDLAWANGTIPTPRGDIRVEWHRDKAGFHLTVWVPEGSEADVRLPSIGPKAIHLADRPESFTVRGPGDFDFQSK
jgi:hypothetical protein